jgi:hypothetical protein
MVQGEASWFMDNFDLPVHKADDLKNFEGVSEKKYYTLEQISEGDCSGMTETDADTSGKMDGPYTEINETKGSRHLPKHKRSAKTDMYNTERTIGFGKLVF